MGKDLNQQFLDEPPVTNAGEQVYSMIDNLNASITIDPTKINEPENEFQSKILDLLLEQQKNERDIFRNNEVYTIEVPDVEDPNIIHRVNVQLTHEIQYYMTILSTGNKADRYAIVSNENPIGEGSFGSIRNVEGTIRRRRNRLSFNNHKKRIRKYQEHIPKNIEGLGEVTPEDLEKDAAYRSALEAALKKCREDIEREAKLLMMTPHSHVKEVSFFEIYNQHGVVIGYESYMISKAFPGKDLFEYRYREPYELDTLTIEQRFELTLNLIRALKEQIHDVGIVHADIKPENIIIDPKTLKVRIVDFGSSDEKIKTTFGGTPLFAAPELFHLSIEGNIVIDARSDIFSLGLVLAMVWGEDIELEQEYLGLEGVDLLKKRCELAEEPLSTLFEEVAFDENDIGRNAILKKQVKDIIKEMLSHDKDIRPDELSLLGKVNEAYLDYKLKGKEEQLQYDLRAANNIGLALYKTLNEGMLNVENYDEEKMRDYINTAINGLPQNASTEVINEFAKAVNIKSFASISSKEELSKKTEEILNTLSKHMEKLDELTKRVEALKEKYKLLYGEEFSIEVSKQLEELAEEIVEVSNKKVKRPLKLDKLASLNKKLTAKIPDVELELRKFEVTLHIDQPNNFSGGSVFHSSTQMIESINGIPDSFVKQFLKFKEIKQKVIQLETNYKDLLKQFYSAPESGICSSSGLLMEFIILNQGIFELSLKLNNKQILLNQTSKWNQLAEDFATKLPTLESHIELLGMLESESNIINQYKKIYDRLEEKPSMEYETSTVAQFKKSIKSAISTYLKNSLTSYNIKYSKGAASDTRRRNIIAVLDILDRSTEPLQMIKALEECLKDIHSYVFFGSTFKKKIMDVVNTYKPICKQAAQNYKRTA